MNDQFKKFQKIFDTYSGTAAKMDRLLGDREPTGPLSLVELGLDHFENDLYDELTSLCTDHSRAHTNGVIGEKNIIAVHMYQPLWEIFKFGYDKIKKLENLLKNAPKEYVRILFESYISYGRKSHELAESGCVDMVIFNSHLRGDPLHPEEIRGFSKSKENNIGGAYADVCITNTIRSIRKYAPYFSIRVIKDATVDEKFFLRTTTTEKILSKD